MELVIYYWDTEKPPPDDDNRLAKIVGCSLREWQRMKPSLLEACFDNHDGTWRHRFYELLREQATITREKNIERAKKAANARYGKDRA